MKQKITLLTFLLSASMALGQVTPPEYLNYQGVLRDAADVPLDGAHDMVFRFYDAPGDAACAGGTLLLTDAHEAAGTGAVEVSGGMFHVDLGGGALTPGTSATLAEVFRDHAEVWLEPAVGGETLCPRVRVMSAGYALNASHLGGLAAGNAAGQIPVSNGARNDDLDADTLDGYHGSSFGKKSTGNTWTGVNNFSNAGNSFTGDGSGLTGVAASNSDTLDGHDSSHFLDTSATQQTKLGALAVQESGALVSAVTASANYYGIDAQGNSAGGYFHDGDGTGYAYVANGGFGMRAYGGDGGGTFSDRDNTSSANLAYGDLGIQAEGNSSGGYFYDGNDSGKAYCGYGDIGVKGEGFTAGGYFVDGDDTTSFAYAGYANYGIWGEGSVAAGYFHHSDVAGGYARVAQGTNGIEAGGSSYGGYFLDTNGTGEAYVGYGDKGIHGAGSLSGGYFTDTNSTGNAYVGYGNRGIEARGSDAAGYFEETDSSARAWLAWKDAGVEAKGEWMGGLFYDATQSGQARLGYGDEGIRAFGNTAGGYFYDRDTPASYAYVGYGDWGVYAVGNLRGGTFKQSDGSSVTDIAEGGWGVDAWGSAGGGYFRGGGAEGVWAITGQYAFGTNYKIRGTGTVSFVQNDPERADRVIVYAAPEGDEVAVYTRGSARLTNGEARVKLGATFRWVANPDVGLTAQLTPRGECRGLYVDSLTTTEMVVRELDGGSSNAAFDYVVYGLRLGYEQTATVQDKREFAPVPGFDAVEPYYEERPELRRYNALERFATMEADLGNGPLDLTRTRELLTAVNRFDPAIDGSLSHATREPEEPGRGEAIPSDLETPGHIQPSPEDARTTQAKARTLPMDEEGNVYARSFRPSAADFATLAVASEPVTPGDVVVLDPDHPGRLMLSRDRADDGVVGIVTAAAGVITGGHAPSETGTSDVAEAERLSAVPGPDATSVGNEIPVAVAGVVLCKVDASYGTIRSRDLLTTSPTPGHAMRADDPRPGTILAKALETLDTGTGVIKVLVMLR